MIKPRERRKSWEPTYVLSELPRKARPIMKNVNKNTMHKCLRLFLFLVIAGIIIAALASIFMGLCHVPLHQIAGELSIGYIALLWILPKHYL
jgi:hypothetical protein